VAIAEYRRHGVDCEDVDTVIDGNIITARGAEDAHLFAELLVGLLKERKAMPAQH
jgi:putative intracellular protease/amidase